ncbi:nucleotidyltransferase domain-containing protein [Micromonospora sp. WMMD975]|uniref:nucleotidyltransferase domain-containing protein n=1 Tax=Micromonospora sp. WMMD975 TaxID=3016087 RepID=UPI002499DA07|nr:nucleotidyltransferase domain-containing protein [Micromonospora sp. WMMD975]WFE35818.1 nucleotidyltransferase domain-containing protein [Micromonospora sp. WMMD975]
MRDDVRDYLADLVRRARDVLGADLVGAYAAGSVGLGAYQPGRSDVDVALLVAGPPAGVAKRSLVDRLRHESLPCPARGLELVVYRRDVAAAGLPEPGFEVELNTGATMPFRATYDPADRPAADGRFWYALDRSILRQSGLTLLGPSAADAFADPPPAALRALLVDALRWWLALPTPPGDEPAPGAEDAVLGACRALVRSRDGVWLAKADAGRRVAVDDPDAALIHRAIAARRGGPPPSGPAARAFQRRVLARLTAAGSAPS